MSKLAFIFPGQGSQYIGMGKDFCENYPKAVEVYETASKASGLDLNSICFEENDRINQTEYTQIAMFATEAAILSCIKEAGIKADVCAGLSLGEYAALYAADVLPLYDLCALVRKRGIYMQNACPTGGAMTAVLGLDEEKIRQICQETEGIVSIANYNCPGQIVITGEAAAVEKAAAALKEAGARRCIPLKVSGPFHSPMLKKAKEQMIAELSGCNFEDPKIPYYANVTAQPVAEKGPIRDLLADQVVSPVHWTQTMQGMIADGVDTFIEIGPGKTLTGFLGKISREVKTYRVSTVEDLKKLLESRKENQE